MPIDCAFNNCIGLKNIIIPNSVTSIGKLAFCGCTSLTSVTIGKGVMSIGKWAFNSCSKLTEMKYNGTMEEWKAIEKGDNWAYNTPFETIHCNDGDIKK